MKLNSGNGFLGNSYGGDALRGAGKIERIQDKWATLSTSMVLF